MPFVVMCAVAAIAWVLLHRSVYGRHLFAVGHNVEAARYSGVRTGQSSPGRTSCPASSRRCPR
jgi:ribose/xylose/arabinose/galactoside ABC-type transport system permease subunit